MKLPIEPYGSINGMNNLLMALLDPLLLQCYAPVQLHQRYIFPWVLFSSSTGDAVPAREEDKWNQSLKCKEHVKRGEAKPALYHNR